jgi:hypothetical protein
MMSRTSVGASFVLFLIAFGARSCGSAYHMQTRLVNACGGEKNKDNSNYLERCANDCRRV